MRGFSNTGYNLDLHCLQKVPVPSSVIKELTYLLPDDKILEWSKLKAFVDDKLYAFRKMIFVFDRSETLWEKEKMLLTRMFSLFNSVFQSCLP